MQNRSELLTVLAVVATLAAGCRAVRPEPLPGEVPVSSETPIAPNPIPTEGPNDTRGPVYVDEFELLIRESFPIQVDLLLRGNLPNPCAILRWSVSEPDEQGRIQVTAYSTQDPAALCIQVIQEFEQSIPLGAYSSGSYSVWLNGEQVGEFEA